MSFIPALPGSLATVPTELEAWEEWRSKIIGLRTVLRERAEVDYGARQELIDEATHDPVMDLILFGAIFEPRERFYDNGLRKPKWMPWIPYSFQVDLYRWIEQFMSVAPGSPESLMGRGDGILEKARGMSGSWSFCGYIGNRWKYDDGFVAGMMSYKEDLVEKTNSTDSLFFKLESYLGLNNDVPEFIDLPVGNTTLKVPTRSPEWLIPKGFNHRLHNQDLTLAHPERTNVVNGYSTGQRTGVGARLTLLFIDEGAKFPSFQTTWEVTEATTDHRAACSSADMAFGTGFRDTARQAEAACKNGKPGPSFLRLTPDMHPERDDVWREMIESRHTATPGSVAIMDREYNLDYEAGQGGMIYPRSRDIEPIPLTFNPANETIDFCIDPGVRDFTAMHLVKYDPGLHRYGVLASYVNSSLPAEFYASLVTASPLYGDYDYDGEEDAIMEWFDRYGRHIRYWVGDPAGKARGGGQATSFYDDFRTACARLTEGRRKIAIWSSDKREYRFVGPRISAMRWFLDITDFNNTPDVLRTLAAIQDHRFKQPREGYEVTSVPTEPVRTWGHDRVVALEYYAVHRKIGTAVLEAGIAKPQRLTMSGKKWTPQPWGSRKKRGYHRVSQYE